MTTTEHRIEAEKFRNEAHALLAELNLMTLLSEHFSEPVLTGSARYDLMVWRDIDIHLPVASESRTDWMRRHACYADKQSHSPELRHRQRCTLGGRHPDTARAVRMAVCVVWRCDI